MTCVSLPGKAARLRTVLRRYVQRTTYKDAISHAVSPKHRKGTCTYNQQRIFKYVSYVLYARSSTPSRVLGIGKVQGMWAYIKSLEAQEKQILEYIERQKVKIKQAQQVVDKARLALIEAAKELKLMEKHKEKWLARIKKEMDFKEQKEMDEIGSAMYATRMIKGFKETKKKAALKKIKEESYGN